MSDNNNNNDNNHDQINLPNDNNNNQDQQNIINNQANEVLNQQQIQLETNSDDNDDDDVGDDNETEEEEDYDDIDGEDGRYDFEEDTSETEEEDEEDDYDTIPQPKVSTAIQASSHNYLGENFNEINTPNVVHEYNDQVTIPILYLPGNSITSFDDENNSVQLLPGQLLPIYFYSPLQIQVIKKRMKDPDPTIGFPLNPRSIRHALSQQTQQQSSANEIRMNDKEYCNLGILAEIISVSREMSEEEQENAPEIDSLVNSGIGMVIKVKGRERFEIIDLKKDITGCVIANVKILPDYVLNQNPLAIHSAKNTQYFYNCYFKMNNPKLLSSFNNGNTFNSKADYLNFTQPHFAFVYRKYDCNYLIYLIKKELIDTFGYETSNSDNEDDPLIFSLWLLNNFPFDNKARINCLKMNCINQRLMFIHSLLKNFTNIVCKYCKTLLCAKSDAFSISKSFMNAFLNPGGVIHETLTVYKLKNFSLSKEPPSLMHTWFPGYGWQILSCKLCRNHIGWKFSTTNSDLKPEKFFGLTRKSLGYSYLDYDNQKISNNDEEQQTE